MIYVPDNNDSPCYYLQSNTVLRAYDTTPRYNGSSTYTDYMLDNHYLSRRGEQSWTNYSTLPQCIAINDITTNYFYRTDITDICILALIFIGVNYFLISKLVKVFFRGVKLY